MPETRNYWELSELIFQYSSGRVKFKLEPILRPEVYGSVQFTLLLGMGPVAIWNCVVLERESIKDVEVPHHRFEPIPRPNIPIACVSIP